jgi:hypothetical protein
VVSRQIQVLQVGMSAPRPTPNLEEQVSLISGSSPLTLRHYVKVGIPSVGVSDTTVGK